MAAYLAGMMATKKVDEMAGSLVVQLASKWVGEMDE